MRVSALFLWSAASAVFAGDSVGTMDNPLPLSCESLGKVILEQKDMADSPVISGEMIVVAENDTAVPPAMLGCPGSRHIVCIMETPSPAKAGDRVHIAGRLAERGDNYLLIDPCGVSME